MFVNYALINYLIFNIPIKLEATKLFTEGQRIKSQSRDLSVGTNAKSAMFQQHA